MLDYENSNWWKYLTEPMRDLVAMTKLLLEQQKASHINLHDYSFVVFPMAKAYEGFLKKLLYDLAILSKQQYYGDRFRIGRALNPNLPKRYQSDWVFGKLVEYCKGQDLPIRMWKTWKRGRNSIFHFFPDHHNFISLTQAEELVDIIIETMDKSLRGCKI